MGTGDSVIGTAQARPRFRIKHVIETRNKILQSVYYIGDFSKRDGSFFSCLEICKRTDIATVD